MTKTKDTAETGLSRADAEAFIRSCAEDEGPESYEHAAAIFAAIFGRHAADEDGDAGDLWSHACAAVLSLVLAVALVGCVGGERAGPATCSVEAGTYQFDFVELSGTCGPVDPTLGMVEGGSWNPGGGDCTGPYTVSADGCDMDFDLVCSDGAMVGTLSITGPRSFAGTMQIDLPAEPGLPACRSLYDVSARRL